MYDMYERIVLGDMYDGCVMGDMYGMYDKCVKSNSITCMISI